MQRFVLVTIASYFGVFLSLMLAIDWTKPMTPGLTAVTIILGVMLWPLIPIGFVLDTLDQKAAEA